MSARSAAARFAIGASTALAWITKGRQGQMTPAKQGRRSGSRLDLDTQADCIATISAAQKDITLDEMVLRRSQDKAIAIGRGALAVWLRTRGWTFKKRPHMQWSKSVRIC